MRMNSVTQVSKYICAWLPTNDTMLRKETGMFCIRLEYSKRKTTATKSATQYPKV